ncbi:alpha/beta fold hydrolase [Rubellimicrobium arenae]|uniref:alpha/beta fold hydrolase n=1 Tax=Rubellimicrobium arenae TaxID=2817372 RepID=UPI001B3144C5|nr:alpha/beta hydrolase [Rubellimicrobium arenae]
MNSSLSAMNDRPGPPSKRRRSRGSRTKLLAAGGLVAALAASAVVNHRRARRAENANPPVGRFLQVDGVRLHYLERGSGSPLVLLHGNGGMIQDFLSSGLVDEAAKRHRVIVFDRPGYGYSDRPRGRLWTPDAQADLLAAALRQLGAEPATVLGHSWAGAVAVAMADRHPGLVSALVLEGGYFYPSVRLDVLPMSLPAVPLAGDVLRHTISPPLSRAIWPLLMRKIFGPERTPDKFRAFPREMALRPTHLRASAEETAMMIPCAAAAQGRYARLRQPTAIIAGEGDRMVAAKDQSARLHAEIPQSTFDCLPGTGHMVHHTATSAVLAAIERVAP